MTPRRFPALPAPTGAWLGAVLSTVLAAACSDDLDDAPGDGDTGDPPATVGGSGDGDDTEAAGDGSAADDGATGTGSDTDGSSADAGSSGEAGSTHADGDSAGETSSGDATGSSSDDDGPGTTRDDDAGSGSSDDAAGSSSDGGTAGSTDDGFGSSSDDGVGSSSSDDGVGSSSSDDGVGSSSSDDGVGSSSSDDDGGSSSDDDGGSSSDDDGGANPSPGCGAPPAVILDLVPSQIEVDGTLRSYWVQLPPGYDPDYPHPVLFGWHGLFGTMGSELMRNDTEVHWTDGPAIGIYPDQGFADKWDTDPESADVLFFDALHELASDDLCVDLDRVYVTGFSSGGTFAYSLGCQRPDVIRGIAGGGGEQPPPGVCDTPQAFWGLHANNDKLIPYETGLAVRDTFLALNGCSADSIVIPTLPPANGVVAECRQYLGCTHLTRWCTHDGGHQWLNEWMTASEFEFYMDLP